VTVWRSGTPTEDSETVIQAVRECALQLLMTTSAHDDKTITVDSE